MPTAVLVVIAAVLLKVAVETALLALARSRATALRAGAVPPEARAAFADDAAFRKAMDYSAAKSRDGIVGELWGGAVTLAMVLGGAAALHGVVSGPDGSGPVWREALAALAFFLTVSALETPIGLWGTFRTEAKFGFNRTTPALWLADMAKGLAVGVALGMALLTPCAWFLKQFPTTWWLWAWLAFSAFRVLAAGVLTVVLLPLFNKLSPLEDGALKERLLGLARRAGFAARSVQVMDGSRRSAHANAFFAGFGRMRRIVLFDTLLTQLAPEELEAVLAHEIGHWKRGHILKTMTLGVLGSLPVFALAGWLSRRPDLLADFGFRLPADGATAPFGALVPLFTLALAPVLYWLAPLANGLSRKHEYEADAYAAGLTGGPAALTGALRKLYAANSGNPLPHPAYALFHHSHPTLPERESALNRDAKGGVQNA